MREVVRFGKRRKLSSRYFGPFEVLERVGTVAYRLALLPNLSSVHEVFYVRLLRSDSQNSLDQGVKSVYVMRVMLQEVGILPTLVYFHPKGCVVMSFP